MSQYVRPTLLTALATLALATSHGTAAYAQAEKPAKTKVPFSLPPGRIGGPSDEVAEICIRGRELRNEKKYDEALAEFDKALKTAKFTKDRAGEAWALSNKATVYRYRADQEADKFKHLVTQATELYEDAATIARESGEKHNEAYATLYLGVLAAMQKDAAAAQKRYDVALQLFEAVGDHYYVGRTYAFQARAALLRQEPMKAVELFEKAVPLLRAVGMFNEVADVTAEIKAVKETMKP